jgi:hypothetical protein
MEPLEYHPSQRQIQAEANTTEIADRLSRWTGPARQFCLLADLFIFATQSEDGKIVFSVLSGAPPLVEVTRKQGFSLILPAQLSSHIPLKSQVGGLAINLSQARRVRINGTAIEHPGGIELECEEVYTSGRKYMTMSAKLESSILAGPARIEKFPAHHPQINETLAQSETAFLATMSPDGKLDVTHRGGLPGFIHYNSRSEQLSWDEYVGDGVFSSAGNIRATGIFSLLVLNHPSGDAIGFHGQAEYINLRSDRRPQFGLRVQYKEPYPVQGDIQCKIESVYLLHRLTHPRLRIESVPRVTSLSTPREQAPQ